MHNQPLLISFVPKLSYLEISYFSTFTSGSCCPLFHDAAFRSGGLRVPRQGSRASMVQQRHPTGLAKQRILSTGHRDHNRTPARVYRPSVCQTTIQFASLLGVSSSYHYQRPRFSCNRRRTICTTSLSGRFRRQNYFILAGGSIHIYSPQFRSERTSRL